MKMIILLDSSYSYKTKSYEKLNQINEFYIEFITFHNHLNQIMKFIVKNCSEAPRKIYKGVFPITPVLTFRSLVRRTFQQLKWVPLVWLFSFQLSRRAKFY